MYTYRHTHMYTYRHTQHTHARAHKHTHDFALRKLRAAKCREAIEYDALENVLYLQINFPTCSRLFVCFLCVWHGAQFTRAPFVLVPFSPPSSLACLVVGPGKEAKAVVDGAMTSQDLFGSSGKPRAHTTITHDTPIHMQKLKSLTTPLAPLVFLLLLFSTHNLVWQRVWLGKLSRVSRTYHFRSIATTARKGRRKSRRKREKTAVGVAG